MRSTPRMGRAANEADALGERAVMRVADAGETVVRAARRMGDRDHVDVVELTQSDQLGLSQDKLQLAARTAGKPLLDGDALLRWHCEQHDIAVELVHDRPQTQSRADHGGDLRV